MMYAEELAVPVVLFTAVAAVLIYFTKRYFDAKRERMLAEAALRKLEMEKGFPPGTYSRCFSGKRMSDRRWRKAQEDAARNASEKERLDLEAGIRDLRERMENIDTIVSDKKGEER